MSAVIENLKQTVHKHKKWEPLVLFVCGFAFDALLLHRIDDTLMLSHQALYLCLAAFIIVWDLRGEVGHGHVPNWAQKFWKHREGALHFILGTLLNVYTIFYFKSGTFLSSLVFLALLAALLFLNEVRPPKISKHMLRNSLFALCLLSYMNILLPITLGFMGAWVFLASVGAAAAVHSLLILSLRDHLESKRAWREIRLPFIAVALIYTSLYLAKVLPPVPLSMKFIGIYRDVERVDGGYRLGYVKSAFRFWESGEQTFEARPGDKVFCFVQVFSPTRFKEQLFVRWKFKGPKLGWTDADAIPLGVVGGRDDGYRGFTSKSNFQPGDWRVSVETADGREVGRVGVSISTADVSSILPPLTYEVR